MEGMRLPNPGQQEESQRPAEITALLAEIDKLSRRVRLVEPFRFCAAIGFTVWVIATLESGLFNQSAMFLTVSLFLTDSYIQSVYDGRERRRNKAYEKLDALRERVENEFRRPPRRLEAESRKMRKLMEFFPRGCAPGRVFKPSWKPPCYNNADDGPVSDTAFDMPTGLQWRGLSYPRCTGDTINN